MPGMNGFQATRKLTQDPGTRDIPVIMITTKDQETGQDLGNAPGGVGIHRQAGRRKDLVEKIQRGDGCLNE